MTPNIQVRQRFKLRLADEWPPLPSHLLHPPPLVFCLPPPSNTLRRCFSARLADEWPPPPWLLLHPPPLILCLPPPSDTPAIDSMEFPAFSEYQDVFSAPLPTSMLAIFVNPSWIR
ncbi:unnamed protein product [Cyclocybe aegerita]|uniref:Uncharacterized protein n=1 Tax=Cyclocybe aegerita TaxID=1973307 RepID=A0A8S0VSW8_CYCAE|nr:unnamed protein product [Cyclocybe aegerita]